MFRIIALAVALSTSAAFAADQQQPDPAFLQRALAEVQAQRNQASDALAAVSARAAGIAEELAKAQALIKELRQPPQVPKPSSAPPE